MSYHIREIKKGKIGDASKITEEYQEFCDACAQNNTIMALLELSDMVGAIEEFAWRKCGVTLDEIIKMKEATARAFEDGTRR